MFGLYRKKRLGTKYNKEKYENKGSQVRHLRLEDVYIKYIKQLINDIYLYH